MKIAWKKAIAWLNAGSSRSTEESILVDRIFMLLDSIPWAPNIDIPLPFHPKLLTKFLSRDWLEGDHINLMLDQLRESLTDRRARAADLDFKIATIANTMSLVSAFENQDERDYMTYSGFRQLRTLGCLMVSGKCAGVGMIMNINGNHWVAMVVDAHRRSIRYGDSFGHPIPDTLLETIHWWIRHHYVTTQDFELTHLPVTHQNDGFSCGMLAMNALSHFMVKDVPLAAAKSVAYGERLRVVANAAAFYIENVSNSALSGHENPSLP
ncbi:hypothetical protein SISNIDRAFT_420937 [Sistotremastrum niveocremeum HHB9708]|uniref:Ubiquitin-like protease family profile domain-containing protein n=1 Tax=Sistotremastrum niveocremeum HHB9708 TaxID=1314777 RepID=A0A164M6Q6_9AGAM|nr:hypothetical protein SISNIDRAFT_420937 [Sistotremastrum niveocremeum HHB9708]